MQHQMNVNKTKKCTDAKPDESKQELESGEMQHQMKVNKN